MAAAQRQEFEGHCAFEACILCFVCDAHSALADLANQTIVADRLRALSGHESRLGWCIVGKDRTLYFISQGKGSLWPYRNDLIVWRNGAEHKG